MDESIYALGFSYFEGIGPKKFALLLEKFQTAKDAWNAAENELVGVLGKTFGPRFLSFRNIFDLAQKKKELDESGIWFVDVSSSDYPSPLREIPDPPIVLFGMGDKSLLTSFGERYIAIVGTRKITSYGVEVTTMMGEQLAYNDYCIVSGLALGVDALAHSIALETNGKTIAVLGCGVDYCYPRENEKIYNEILRRNCLVISEYPPGTTPTPGSFPSRNRIIAGISAGVLVTQGAIKSGSLITAEYALSLGRPVFAVPGPITSSLSQGTNELLKEGAVVVSSVGDILNALGQSPRIVQKNVIRGDTPQEQMIIESLSSQSLSFDELVKKLSHTPQALGPLLSIMEMKGLILRDNAGNFMVASLS